MDSADQLSAEGIDNENYQSSSSNLNNAHHDILGKIKSKRKPIFKLMKRSNIKKKCSSYSGPGHNRRNQNENLNSQQLSQLQCSNSILNLPQNLSLEQKDSSINNNPSQNNLEDDDLFSFNGSFCQSPPFGHIKECIDDMSLNEQLTDIKNYNSPSPLNALRLSSLNSNPLNLAEDQQIAQNQNSSIEQNYKQSSKKVEKQNARLSNQEKQKKKQTVRNNHKIKISDQEEQEDLHNIGFEDEQSHSPFDTESLLHNTEEIRNQYNGKDFEQNHIDDKSNYNGQNDCSNNNSANINNLDKKQLQQQQYSRREKSLEELSKKFLTIFLQKEQMLISLDKITQQLDVERRRIYDIINILESLKLVTRRGKNNYKWNGFEQIFDTIQFFNSQSCSQSDKQDFNITVEQNEKKEKSLEILSIGFLKLFLNYKQTLSLEEAARKLSPNNSENQKIKTKIRRLYDIANVFKSLGLIKKVQLNETKKPAFQWVGLSGLQDFYNSSKDKEDVDVNVDMEETKKTIKASKKDLVNKQKSSSISNAGGQSANEQKHGNENDNFIMNTNDMNQLLQVLENNNQQNLQVENNQNNQETNKQIKDSQINCGFLSNSKNSAFKRVSKSLTDTSKPNSLNNSDTKKLIFEQNLQESPPQQITSNLKRVQSQLEQATLEDDLHYPQDKIQIEMDIPNQMQQKQRQSQTQSKMEQIYLSEEKELIILLEKMRLQNLIADKNENIQNVLKQNPLGFNQSLRNNMNEDNNLNNLGLIGTNSNKNQDSKILFQFAAADKASKQIAQVNAIFNSKNSAFNMTNKKRIEDKPINQINKNCTNNLLQLFEPLKKLTKLNQNNNQQYSNNSNIFNSNNSSDISDNLKLNKTSSNEMILEKSEEETNQNTSLFSNQINKLSCLENVVRNQIFQSNSFNSSLIDQNLNQLFSQKDKQNLFLSLTSEQNTNLFNQENNINTSLQQQQQQTRKQSIQSESNKKEINNKKKQKQSIDRYNSILPNSSNGSFKDNYDINNSSNSPNQHSINHKKEKFKTKSNSLYDDRKALSEQERLQELVKFNKDEDQVFYSPNKVMQCIKKRKKGQEDIISTSVSSNQSSDSKIHQIPLYLGGDTLHFQAPMQPQQASQKILQIIQQQQPLQSTLAQQNLMKSIIN